MNLYELQDNKHLYAVKLTNSEEDTDYFIFTNKKYVFEDHNTDDNPGQEDLAKLYDLIENNMLIGFVSKRGSSITACINAEAYYHNLSNTVNVVFENTNDGELIDRIKITKTANNYVLDNMQNYIYYYDAIKLI